MDGQILDLLGLPAVEAGGASGAAEGVGEGPPLPFVVCSSAERAGGGRWRSGCWSRVVGVVVVVEFVVGVGVGVGVVLVGSGLGGKGVPGVGALFVGVGVGAPDGLPVVGHGLGGEHGHCDRWPHAVSSFPPDFVAPFSEGTAPVKPLAFALEGGFAGNAS